MYWVKQLFSRNLSYDEHSKLSQGYMKRAFAAEVGNASLTASSLKSRWNTVGKLKA